MNEDLKIIKKYYGEKMMHLCRELFPTILESDGLLSKLMLDNFNPSHDLYYDIIYIAADFRDYIYSLIDVEKETKKIIVTKSPEELLKEVGYKLYECKTEEEIQSFKKYYKKGEELCTFNGGRLNRCHVFFVVKEDVEKIKRKDYKNPKREDKYGTSVMSLQFTKDSSHTLSIKNRYNHTVNNPDATYKNNLDNIVIGLTQSFENEYGLIQKYKNNGFSIRDHNYVRANDGRYYKYYYEFGNIYYCPDNIIIDNFEVKRLEKEKHILIDYFVLDLESEHKKIRLYDKRIEDSFPESIPNIDKVRIEKEGKNKKIVITSEEGEDVIITINKRNRIIGLINNNVKEIGDSFLFYSILKSINLSNVEKIGNCFLYCNRVLTSISLPKARVIGNKFLCCNKALTSMSLPSATTIGYESLYYNEVLKYIYAPEVEKIGKKFLRLNKKLIRISLLKILCRLFDEQYYLENELTIRKVRKLSKRYNKEILKKKELEFKSF